jgi:hypothetical protein
VNRPRNILFFANTNHNADCVAEHISGVKADSKHNWFVVNVLKNRMAHKLNLNHFDAIGFHYSIHPHESYYCSNALFKKIQSYSGVKFLFLQDEYENVNLTSLAMVDLGIDILFTVVRPELHHLAYDHPKLVDLKRVTVMAGYAPSPNPNYEFVPLEDRNMDIFYRSRVCPLNSGSLGYEKSLIAKKVQEKAVKYDLKVDISIREEDRVYGQEWIGRLSSCRATLGTESGASVWDRDGSVARALDIALGKNPQATFNDLCETVLKPYDGKLIYSSISPRIFEAASLKTPQILFPGWYNGLIKPGIHYFQLEKDFSNFDEMVKLLKDDCSLSKLAENAYQDLIASELYDKKSLGSLVNQELENSMSLNSFASSSEPRVVEEAIEGIEKNYKYAKIFLNVTTEISFGVQHVLKVLRNPRYKGIRKFKRLYEILLRYCTHLKPRLVRN